MDEQGGVLDQRVMELRELEGRGKSSRSASCRTRAFQVEAETIAEPSRRGASADEAVLIDRRHVELRLLGRALRRGFVVDWIGVSDAEPALT